jgi:hypothetical protein
VVSALVAQMAQKSVVRAVEIERDLLAAAGALVSGVPVEPPPVKADPSRTSASLQLSRGKG